MGRYPRWWVKIKAARTVSYKMEEIRQRKVRDFFNV